MRLRLLAHIQYHERKTYNVRFVSRSQVEESPSFYLDLCSRLYLPIASGYPVWYLIGFCFGKNDECMYIIIKDAPRLCHAKNWFEAWCLPSQLLLTTSTVDAHSIPSLSKFPHRVIYSNLNYMTKVFL